MARYEDLTGQKFGKLTVKEYVGTDRWRVAKWKCKCDCGKEVTVISCSLKTGNTKSCGCLVHKHGMSYSKLYRTWAKMKGRCYYKKAHNYKYYGGKGVTICKEWKEDFNAFKDWAYANGYEEGLTIDRIDPNGNYEPSNCQWLSSSENIKKMHKKHKKDGLPAGVYKRNYGGEDRYLALSHISKKTKYLGTFDTPEEAKRAREKAMEAVA